MLVAHRTIYKILIASTILSVSCVLFQNDVAANPISHDVVITANVAGTMMPNDKNDSARLRVPTSVHFSGRALGFSSVGVTRDGQYVGSARVDLPTGNFQIAFPVGRAGSYTYALYAVTSDGRRTPPQIFALTITLETVIIVKNISFSFELLLLLDDSGDCNTVRSDINCDHYVDLIDFTLLLPWYHRTIYPFGSRVDINKDGRGTLSDFSIMAYEWTAL